MDAAEMTRHSLAELLKNHQIKTFGRTALNLAGDGIKTDWSASGFEMKLDSVGGEMTVTYRASYDIYWAVMVNGEQIARIKAEKGDGSFCAALPGGSITVSIVKDTQVSTGANDCADLLSVSVPGTLLERTADKALYIEFIGDSYSCGDGAVGIYQPGVAWQLADHAATKAFTYLTAKALNADYSIVARGGIGLTKGAGGTMPQVYAYTSGYRDQEDVYGFVRKPDIIVVELGANDGVGDLATWKSLLSDFLDLIREKNGPQPQIVFYTHKTHFSCQIHRIIEQRAETDANLHICHYSHNGFGSAALVTQKEGHPGEQDHKDMAQALTAYLRNEILGMKPAETGCTDIVYRVENTDLQDATGRAVADHGGAFPNGSRLVLYIGDHVTWKTGDILGGGLLKREDGSRLPILITADPDSTEKATVYLTSVDNHIGNDVTLKNLCFRSSEMIRLYAAGGHAVVEDITAQPGEGWGAGLYAGFGRVPVNGEALSTLTLRSGRYGFEGEGFGSVAAIGGYEFRDGITTRLIAEAGAQIGTLCGVSGSCKRIGNVEVIVRGAAVKTYRGIRGSGKWFSGNLRFEMTAGTVTESFCSIENATLMGSVENVICGGEIRVATDICLGGRNSRIEKLTNVISGGKLYRLCADDADCGIYFGVGQKGSVSQMENRITGGAVAMIPQGSVPAKCGIWLGSRDGSVGTLTNRFTNGCLDLSMVGAGGYYLGSRDGSVGTVRNILGSEGRVGGPRFLGSGINTALAGENARVGQVENGIYSAAFQDTVYAGTMGKGTVTGSVTNTVHNGMFENNFYCGSKDAGIAGQVNTEILGGIFRSICGGCARGTVRQGIRFTARDLQMYDGGNIAVRAEVPGEEPKSPDWMGIAATAAAITAAAGAVLVLLKKKK